MNDLLMMVEYWVFLYISIVRQMILKSLILKHFFSIFMMDGPIKTMAQNAWHSGRFS